MNKTGPLRSQISSGWQGVCSSFQNFWNNCSQTMYSSNQFRYHKNADDIKCTINHEADSYEIAKYPITTYYFLA